MWHALSHAKGRGRDISLGLVPPVRISTMFGSSMHPARLRCSARPPEHVLPNHFVKIRYFGIMSSGNVKSSLGQARALLPAADTGTATAHPSSSPHFGRSRGSLRAYFGVGQPAGMAPLHTLVVPSQSAALCQVKVPTIVDVAAVVPGVMARSSAVYERA